MSYTFLYDKHFKTFRMFYLIFGCQRIFGRCSIVEVLCRNTCYHNIWHLSTVHYLRSETKNQLIKDQNQHILL